MTEVFEVYHSVGTTRDGRPVARTYLGPTTLLSVTADTASLHRSQENSGVNKHSGKPYRSWKKTSSTYCSYRSGKLRIYQKTYATRRSPMFFRDITAQMSRPFGDTKALFEAALSIEPTGTVGQVSTFDRLAFPLLREAPDSWRAQPGISAGLRHSTVQDFVVAEFGKSRYRKDLVRAVAEAKGLEGVALASHLRGVVPVDWLVDFIKQSSNWSARESDMRTLFKSLAPATARKLLLQDDRLKHSWIITDAIRDGAAVVSAMPATNLKFKDWQDVHDWSTRERRKIQSANREIPQGSIAKKLDGSELDGIQLTSAKQTHELINWGAAMNNCIGGYAEMAVRKTTYLFAAWRGETMIGNMEVSTNGTIRQFVGKHNRALPGADADTIQKMVGKLTVKDVTHA